MTFLSGSLPITGLGVGGVGVESTARQRFSTYLIYSRPAANGLKPIPPAIHTLTLYLWTCSSGLPNGPSTLTLK